MRPMQLKAGDEVLVQMFCGRERKATFLRRVPSARAIGGSKAVNYFRFPDFAGLNGLEDDGTCEMSDYQVSRQVLRIVGETE